MAEAAKTFADDHRKLKTYENKKLQSNVTRCDTAKTELPSSLPTRDDNNITRIGRYDSVGSDDADRGVAAAVDAAAAETEPVPKKEHTAKENKDLSIDLMTDQQKPDVNIPTDNDDGDGDGDEEIYKIIKNDLGTDANTAKPVKTYSNKRRFGRYSDSFESFALPDYPSFLMTNGHSPERARARTPPLFRDAEKLELINKLVKKRSFSDTNKKRDEPNELADRASLLSTSAPSLYGARKASVYRSLNYVVTPSLNWTMTSSSSSPSNRTRPTIKILSNVKIQDATASATATTNNNNDDDDNVVGDATNKSEQAAVFPIDTGDKISDMCTFKKLRRALHDERSPEKINKNKKTTTNASPPQTDEGTERSPEKCLVWNQKSVASPKKHIVHEPLMRKHELPAGIEDEVVKQQFEPSIKMFKDKYKSSSLLFLQQDPTPKKRRRARKQPHDAAPCTDHSVTSTQDDEDDVGGGGRNDS